VLAGSVERVTFHNEENGFCVLRVNARGHRDFVTVVGHAATISAGEFIRATGEWVNSREHGLQFRARHLRASPPDTAEGLERYLGSGMIRGIGPVYAKRLVAAFGTRVFEVVEAEPEKLRTVGGIGPVRAARIAAGWAEQKIVREIMLFLHAHGVGTARAVRIQKTYGAEAVRLISEDPYRLARDIRGIGFRTADTIAARLGIEPTAPMRVRAGVSHALAEALEGGHCGLPRDELVPLAAELLGVAPDLVLAALAEELASGRVIADRVAGRDCVFLPGLHRAEGVIAERLRRLAARATGSPWGEIEVEKAIGWVEERIGFTLAEGQRAALALAAASRVCVVTGGPGVGKTTLVDAILRVVGAKGARILLCAPTGRAARRLSETSGREALTVHRLLEADPARGGFKRDEERPLDCDLLVVDETSMVDVPLMHALLRALPEGAALLLVGDVDQLPSVGPGQVLADIISSGAVPVARLTEVFRQAARSRIIQAAHALNGGRLPDLSRPAEGEESDFYFVPADGPEAAAARVVEVVRERIPRRFGFDPVRDVQVLCPMNRGASGARSLNEELQRALNPPGDRPTVSRFGWTYAVGDKVMQTENDYEKEVANGDIGFIEAIDTELGEIRVNFDGRAVTYALGELDEVSPAYAVTVHKSQGSEYPAVVVPVTTGHYPMLQRNLLYTAVTRGRRLVVIVGQRKAIAIAARTETAGRRWTRLQELLAPVAAPTR
jgi:exodeoxyribonuclease V alpha subunit